MLFSTLFSLWSWTILPDLLTHRLLTFSYQKLNITPTPRRNTATYHRHYTLLFSLLVSIWLCYDLVRFFTKQGEEGYGSFYEMLGVGVHVDENGLKAGFRQVAKRIHPDRNYLNNFNQNNNNNVQVEEAFVRVRQVYEALRNPNMRFAYDRFGPNVLSWTSCRTRRDFMVHGSLQAGGYYIVSGGTLLIWSLFHKSNFLSFWRWILFCLFLFTEFILLFSTTTTVASSFWVVDLLTWISPSNRVIYHHILFLRHLFPILNIILGRLVPLFFPPSRELDQRVEKALMEKTKTLVNLTDRQGKFLFA